MKEPGRKRTALKRGVAITESGKPFEPCSQDSGEHTGILSRTIEVSLFEMLKGDGTAWGT